MAETEQKEYSEELKALALRFFSFDDAFFVKRTEDFMAAASEIHGLREEIDALLKIMRSGKPFKMDSTTNVYGYGVNPVAKTRNSVNEYSMESIYIRVYN